MKARLIVAPHQTVKLNVIRHVGGKENFFYRVHIFPNKYLLLCKVCILKNKSRYWGHNYPSIMSRYIRFGHYLRKM